MGYGVPSDFGWDRAATAACNSGMLATQPRSSTCPNAVDGPNNVGRKPYRKTIGKP